MTKLEAIDKTIKLWKRIKTIVSNEPKVSIYLVKIEAASTTLPNEKFVNNCPLCQYVVDVQPGIGTHPEDCTLCPAYGFWTDHDDNGTNCEKAGSPYAVLWNSEEPLDPNEVHNMLNLLEKVRSYLTK